MDQLFLITIPKGAEIYRGFSEKNKPDGHWFAYDVYTASMYGKLIKKYILKEDIKVVNIQNGFFHIDYINKVNLLYTGTDYDGVDERKVRALVPLGLPDVEFQMEFLSRVKIGRPTINEDYISRMLFNKNRLSLYSLDEEFVSTFDTLYRASCDGWSNPIKYHDKYTGKYLQREIYIFDLTKLEFIQDIHMPVAGGKLPAQSEYPYQIDPATLNERITKMMDDIRREVYSKPPLRRDDGIYDRPPVPLVTPPEIAKLFNDTNKRGSRLTRKLKRKTD